ncbi:MAG: YHYH protein [Pseudomonadota bacterium]
MTIKTDANYRYIESNGIPDHTTGRFPNSGNPNAITEQEHSYRVTLNPKKTDKKTSIKIAGVAKNGVPMEPGTAEFWNRDRSSGWNIQAFASGVNLGIDSNNAHVQPTGSYHYHGKPTGIINKSSDTLVGWAADGFEIHYLGSKAKSSYKLKSGTRSSGPGGSYDGTYDQDWEYAAEHGNLDECNGGELNGSYAYFITDSYPFIQRCVFGTPDGSFTKRGGGGGPGGPGMRGGDDRRGPPPRHGDRDRPPPPRY